MRVGLSVGLGLQGLVDGVTECHMAFFEDCACNIGFFSVAPPEALVIARHSMPGDLLAAAGRETVGGRLTLRR